MSEDKTFTFPNDAIELEIKGSKPTGGSMTVNKYGKVEMAITNGKYCVTKGYEDEDVTISDNLEACIVGDIVTDYADAILNGADPVLRTGMIPVKIEANGTVRKADVKEEWYNYGNKVWANAVLVDNDSRDNYETMAAGEPILEEDILAYFNVALPSSL